MKSVTSSLAEPERVSQLSELCLLDQFKSPAVAPLKDAISKLAPSATHVLIIGESGLWKGVIAQKLHNESARAAAMFVERDAVLVSPGWLDELKSGNLGPVGSLFIAGIEGLSVASQKALMEYWLDSGDVTIPRLLMSTSRSPDAANPPGTALEAFQCRISTVCLRVPALRHRPEDLDCLIEFYLTKYSGLLGHCKPHLSEAMLELLHAYSWPGNIREVEEVMKTVAAIEDEKIATLALRARLSGATSSQTGTFSLKQVSRAASRSAEREVILDALGRNRWNRKRAAANLGISYKALLYKLKQIGIDDRAVGSEGEA